MEHFGCLFFGRIRGVYRLLPYIPDFRTPHAVTAGPCSHISLGTRHRILVSVDGRAKSTSTSSPQKKGISATTDQKTKVFNVPEFQLLHVWEIIFRLRMMTVPLVLFL